MSTVLLDPARAGAALVDAHCARWLAPADIVAPAVILIHGFTADGTYLKPCAEYFQRYGWSVAIFNYDSYEGIRSGAMSLKRQLEPLREKLAEFGYVIIAHSMGGLVARYYNRFCNPLHNLRGLVMLGSPHRGAVASGRSLVGYMIDWADAVTVAHPFARHPSCVASQELTLNDDAKLIDLLQAADTRAGFAIPVMTVSGGLEFLELGAHGGSVYAKAKNLMLQRAIGERPNDGLVAESSACLTSMRCSGDVIHNSTYSSWKRTNHTYLVHNQEIAATIAVWVRERCFI